VLLAQAITEFSNGYFSTHQRSAKTEVAYRSDLDQVVAYAGDAFCLSSLDPAFIENWAADLRLRNYSPASIRRKMVVLKVFCSYWVRRGVLVESPFWRVKLSFGRIVQLPRSLSESEMRGLLVQAKQRGLGTLGPRECQLRCVVIKSPRYVAVNSHNAAVYSRHERSSCSSSA
jgi:site-specific recombinase XerD